jgi:hypothetical protein
MLTPVVNNEQWAATCKLINVNGTGIIGDANLVIIAY